MALLVAAFPQVTLENESEQVFVAAVMKLHNPDSAREAVEALAETAEGFPTIARIRATYGSIQRQKIEASERDERNSREVSEDEREHVRAMIGQFMVRLGVAPEETSGCEKTIAGNCGDCDLPFEERVQYGSFKLCSGCLRLRLLAGERLAEEAA